MSKLKELEKRLKDEPDNLGLRVMVAGALIEAGRRADAIELYHSVAIAYRDHGRLQQAITVCRSILELAPDHAACRDLLGALTLDPMGDAPSAEPPGAAPRRLASLVAPAANGAPSAEPLGGLDRPHGGPRPAPPQLRLPSEPGEDDVPPRRSSVDLTPLPAPLAYHEADPTWSPRPLLTRADLPPSLQQELAMVPEIEGIAHAARQISASLLAARQLDPSDADGEEADDLSDDLSDDGVELTDADDAFDTRRRARLDPHAALEHLGTLRPTVPLGRLATPAPDADDADDDELTLPPNLGAIPHMQGGDDDETRPREAPTAVHAGGPGRVRPGSPVTPWGPAPEPHSPAHPTRSALAPEPVTDRERPAPELEPVTDRERPAPELEPVTDRERPALELEPVTDQVGSASSPDLGAGLDLDAAADPRRSATIVDPTDRDLPALDWPEPATEPRNLADRARPASPHVPASAARELPRSKPPSLAPATHATGPLLSTLFEPVPPRNRIALLQRFRRRIAAIGTTVIRRGEAEHGLILVVRGQLDVHAERSDGARVSLEAIGPGNYVGEIGLVSRTPAAAYVVAAVESELLVLDAPDFYEVAGQFPAFWSAVSAVADRRHRDHTLRLQA
jgi:hypothetical protein